LIWLGRQDSNLGVAEIKIQVFALFIKAFRKNAETRPQFDQEVGGNFGMPGTLAMTRAVVWSKN
jgi:hypothetical protein